MPERSALRRSICAAGRAILVSWQVFGVTLVLFAVIEVGVRIQSTARSALATSVSVVDPRHQDAWYAGFMNEFNATRAQRWIPYLYFGRNPSYRGRYINIDSLGHRITPQPARPTAPRARVFFFGGSTMWGTNNRDDHTIPAEASRRLQLIAGPGSRIEVANFGENGYVMTQGIVQLMLLLREGKRPDVVVFYAGLNDAGATVQSGVPGLPQNESKRVEEFAFGRVLDRTGFEHGAAKDTRALGFAFRQFADRLAAVELLKSWLPPPATTYIPADAAALGTVAVFVENVRIVEALAGQYGFKAIYIWQPTVHATTKLLTPYEQKIARQIQADPFQRRLSEVHRAILPLIDSAMTNIVRGRFINAASIFQGDGRHIFVDLIGHTSESATPTIVDAFWPQLAAAVTSMKRSRATHPSDDPLRLD